MIRILVVEDDHLQAAGIQKGLEDSLAATHGPLKVKVVSTESRFHKEFEEIANASFDLAIIDVMLRWADPTPDMTKPPDEVLEGGFFRAGLRCKKLLEENLRTKQIPVLIYTVLDSGRLPQGVDFVAKTADLTPLVERVRQILPPPP